MDYIFKNYKAYSIQAVVFESPLVSLRVKRQSNGGTANTFVGITLYDKEGNEIFIKDIKLEKLRPIILFKRKLYKSMKTCLYYNEEKDLMDNDGIETQFIEFNGEEYIKCIPKHLTSFTIGSYLIGKNINTKEAKNETLKIGFVFVILLFGAFYLYRTHKKKSIENVKLLF